MPTLPLAAPKDCHRLSTIEVAGKSLHTSEFSSPFHHVDLNHKACCKIHPKTLANPFIDASKQTASLNLSSFSSSFMSWPTCNTIEPAFSSVRVRCSGSSSPEQSVSISFSVYFPFGSSRLCSIMSSPSRQASSFEMAFFILSSMSCWTCCTIEPASSFACVQCPGCSPSVSLTVATSSFTSISENSPSASFASASVFFFFFFHFLLVMLFFCFGGFFFALDSLLCLPLQFLLQYFNVFFGLKLLIPSVFSV